MKIEGNVLKDEHFLCERKNSVNLSQRMLNSKTYFYALRYIFSKEDIQGRKFPMQDTFLVSHTQRLFTL